MGGSELANFFPEPRETVAPVWREMLRDPDFTEKSRIVLQDFGRSLAAIEVGQNERDPANDMGIRIDIEVAAAVAEFGDEPEVRKTAFYAIGVGLKFGRKVFRFFRLIDNVHEAVLSRWQQAQVVDQLAFFGVEAHVEFKIAVGAR